MPLLEALEPWETHAVELTKQSVRISAPPFENAINIILQDIYFLMSKRNRPESQIIRATKNS
jgi:hypothetical protein